MTKKATQELETIDPEAMPAVVVTPMQLLQQAMDNGADLDKMTQLMDLQERWEKGEARKAFVSALVAFKAKAPVLKKDKSVNFGGGKTAYNHASLGNAAKILGPILSEHGLAYSYDTNQTGDALTVTCVLTHVMGHSERVSLTAGPDGSGSKNAIQGLGSAITYLERYTLLAVTGVATEEDDDGGGLTISEEQKAELVALMQETGADTASFLSYLHVEALDDLRAEYFGKAKHALETKKNKGSGDPLA